MSGAPVSAGHSAWLLRQSTSRDPSFRLIGFPYAGGGASIFRRWACDLPASVELVAVQLPGRENRLREALHYDLPSLVYQVIDELAPCLADGTPFVLFGHSLGALIAFEVARGLRRRSGLGPAGLIVSGRTPPQICSKRQLHALPDTELLREIRQLDGIPMEIADHREMLDLILPALRADLTVDETYLYVKELPLNCPILALGGVDDPEVSPSDLIQWALHTQSGFSMKTFPGGHFFLHTSQKLLTSQLSAYLTSLMVS
jgi:medium-chain acyl-[acyl-carrier-protein] hydrolase